jgi:hypothetical protein
MEVNRFEDVYGSVTLSGFTEGRLCIMTSHTYNYDYGSRTDLPGVRPPATADEAAGAVYIVTWPVTNAEAPFLIPQPSYNWALRLGGFDQASNMPAATSIYLTWPGNQNQVALPSGVPALAFGQGTYTIYSGDYVNTAAIQVPGCPVQVCNTAEDGTQAGMLKALTVNASFRKIGYVELYDPTTGALTFSIRP